MSLQNLESERGAKEHQIHPIFVAFTTVWRYCGWIFDGGTSL
jgi:hypothetical protein